MKRKYFIATLLLIVACQKEINQPSQDIQGTWELESSYSAWSVAHTYAPGNGNTYNFKGNTYSQKIIATDTTYQYSGIFNIYTGKPCENAVEQTLINFDNGNAPAAFSLSNGKLTIATTECIADGGGSTYIKVR
ncbi:MAG: hypothetical protein JO072_11200 [Parafilimonas sp.]|nr:hypothetical protein [Parafilimonas sp.]